MTGATWHVILLVRHGTHLHFAKFTAGRVVVPRTNPLQKPNPKKTTPTSGVFGETANQDWVWQVGGPNTFSICKALAALASSLRSLDGGMVQVSFYPTIWVSNPEQYGDVVSE